MADKKVKKTKLENALEILTSQQCEKDHDMPVGARFCEECGSKPKANDLVVQVNALTVVVLEIGQAMGTEDSGDDLSVGRKFLNFINREVGKKEEKSK